MARRERKIKNAPGWVGYSVTDWDNETVDVGRVTVFFVVFGLVSLVILAMLIFTGYDVILNKNRFDPQSLGIGVGGLLGGISTVLMGLGVYLFGDSRSRETVEAFQQTTFTQQTHQGTQNGTTQNGQNSRGTTTSTTLTQAPSGTSFTVKEEGSVEEGSGASGDFSEGTGEAPIGR